LTTIAEIRNMLNMPDVLELSDAVIQVAIDDANTLINYKSKTKIAAMKELATKRQAAYLAYLSYSDHVVHTLPGSVSETDGSWDPVAVARERTVRDKLAMLKSSADEALLSILGPKIRIRSGTSAGISR